MKISAAQTKAIQKTAVKTGAMFKAMAAAHIAAPILDKLREFINSLSPLSPLMPVISQYYTALAGFVTAENAENIKKIADSLFSEESIENMKKIAVHVTALSDVIVAAIPLLNEATTAYFKLWDDIYAGMNNFRRIMEAEGQLELERKRKTYKEANEIEAEQRQKVIDDIKETVEEKDKQYRILRQLDLEISQTGIIPALAKAVTEYSARGVGAGRVWEMEHLQEGGDIIKSGAVHVEKGETVLSAGTGEEISSKLDKLIELQLETLQEKKWRHR